MEYHDTPWKLHGFSMENPWVISIRGVLKGSHSFTCTRREHPLTEWIIPAFAFQPKLVLIYRPRRDGRLSWSWVAGWLHTEINVRHRELDADTVAQLSTNRARRWLTSLIEANALTITPDHQVVNDYPKYVTTGVVGPKRVLVTAIHATRFVKRCGGCTFDTLVAPTQWFITRVPLL